MKTLTIGETLGFLGGLEQYCFQVANALGTLGHSHVLLYERAGRRRRARLPGRLRGRRTDPRRRRRSGLREIPRRYLRPAPARRGPRPQEPQPRLHARAPAPPAHDHHRPGPPPLLPARGALLPPQPAKSAPCRWGRNVCSTAVSWGGRCVARSCRPSTRSAPRKKLLAAHRDCHGVIVPQRPHETTTRPQRLRARASRRRARLHRAARNAPPRRCHRRTARYSSSARLSAPRASTCCCARWRCCPARTLVAVGDGSALSANKALAAELGVADRVEFTGRAQPRPNSKNTTPGTLVQAVPSVWAEPFGLVGLEAMVRRRPVGRLRRRRHIRLARRRPHRHPRPRNHAPGARRGAGQTARRPPR